MDFSKPENNNSSFLDKVKYEIQVFENINFILDKIQSDGYFESVKSTFSVILSEEMAFAIGGTIDKN